MPPFADDWAFFLDLDGTLLEYAAHPGAVHVDEDLIALLGRLQQAAGGAAALISGRSVRDIDGLFAPLKLPAAGQHGIEVRFADGAVQRHPAAIGGLERAAAAIVRLTSAHPGLVLENKGMTMALHYRLEPALGELVEREMAAIAASLGRGFELQRGKFVVELKPSGRNKGHAIAELCRSAPFTGRVPVFVGDDLTDESGFGLVNRLGGHSVKVGAGPTSARWRMPDAGAVRAWLVSWVERRATLQP
jgi:trehalose 6-phosphate phosphatase